MAQCCECQDVMKTGIPIQKSPKESIVWVCKKCWDAHDYGSYLKRKDKILND